MKCLLLSPTLGSASLERSLFPRRGGWPEVCFQQNTGCRGQRGPLESYSTRDASSFPGHMTPSTETTQVKGQNRSIHLGSLISAWQDRHCSPQGLSLDNQAKITIGITRAFTGQWGINKLTGPHSDMVQWRSQGGPVQFLMFGGLVIGSHGLVSSEHRTSRVTWALRPHLAGHWTEAQTVYAIYFLLRKRSGMARTSVHSATSHCGPQAGLLQGRLSMGRSRSAMVQSSL